MRRRWRDIKRKKKKEKGIKRVFMTLKIVL
jgi:hypothetical protein